MKGSHTHRQRLYLEEPVHQVMVIIRWSYEVHAKVGNPGTHPVELLTILDTGAEPNFIQKDIMADKMKHITDHGAFPNILDANGNPIRMTGRSNLQVELGTYGLTLDFISCDLLAAPCILGADLCNKIVLVRRPKDRLV